jgi:hypothetical protein
MSKPVFATDPIGEAQIARAAHWFAQERAGAAWLLVDMALVGFARVAREVERHGLSLTSTLADTPLAAYGEAAPHLIPAPSDAAKAAALLRALVQIDPCAPAYSWVQTRATADAPLTAFSYLALLQVDGDLPLHCRFADTRVLPELLRTLTPKQTAPVAAAITSWHWFDRHGDAQTWLAAATDNGQPQMSEGETLLELDARQFQKMLDASEPDTLFALLTETAPELIPAEQGGALYTQIAAHLDDANRLGVVQAPDRLQFVALCLSCRKQFFEHPALSPTWLAIREKKGSLSDLMEQWSEELWRELERAGQKTQ